MANGDDEKRATTKAITQMGDAVWIGQELDKTHRPKPQWTLIALTGILMGIGMLVHYFIDTAESSHYTFSPLPFIVAWVLFVACYFIDFSVFGRYPLQFYMATLILSIAGISLSTATYYGQAFWVLGPFSISFAYLSLLFPVAFALLVYAMRSRGYWGILLSGIGFFPLAIILLMTPTLVGFVSYTLSALCVLCFAISRGWFKVHKTRGLLLVLLPTFTTLTFSLLFLAQYYTQRFWSFFHPDQNPFGTGYVYNLIRDFLSQAQFFGQGDFPESGVVPASLPFIKTVYPLTFLAHQFGVVFLAVIIVFLAIFAVFSLYKAWKEKSVLGALIALSIALTFILQCTFYLAANLGYGLIAPLSLPFISYGKSALFLNAALTGFMLSIFRTGEAYEEHQITSRRELAFISYKDGTLSIRLKG
ncbi:FtsW/RodA/SpoVE family cell cycle protein [Aminipila butyrica]|uniref:FtsW/RodA/SpoVE family cell cycle protein n=2 Tax=Aminipila butyrica TaxID=433296 RepID=A0A858BWJ4_9FIRM|nr:FtsW/RodA/SpoVE family cell cycle protein [Aminipila butyrica]